MMKERGRPRSGREHYRRKRRIAMVRRMVPLAAFVGVALFGGWKLSRSLMGLGVAKDVNERLEAIYEQAAEEAGAEAAFNYVDDAGLEPEEEPVTEEDSVQESTQTQARAARRTVYQYIGDTVMKQSQAMQEINSDFVGWINIPGVLSLPVAYRDNEYYINHNFYREENESGTVFLDAGHPFEEKSQYLLMHGHNVYDGSMLAMLTHFRNSDYIKAHPYLYFNTLYRQERYEIFGVMVVEEREMYGLMRMGSPQFRNDAEFNSFIDSLRRNSLRFTDAEIPSDAAILGLSTCWNDERIVVMYQRVEEGDD